MTSSIHSFAIHSMKGLLCVIKQVYLLTHSCAHYIRTYIKAHNYWLQPCCRMHSELVHSGSECLFVLWHVIWSDSVVISFMQHFHTLAAMKVHCKTHQLHNCTNTYEGCVCARVCVHIHTMRACKTMPIRRVSLVDRPQHWEAPSDLFLKASSGL